MVNQSNNIFFHFGTAHEKISDMISKYGLISLIILDQVHGNDGHVITQHNAFIPFKSEVALLRPSLDTSEGFQQGFEGQGDYLITNQRNIGLGVLTADCLPIIFVDNVTGAVGIAHAGWRGSVKNITSITVARMQQEYGTKIEELSVFFGPCAKVCCYEVQLDFKNNFPDENKFFVQRGNQLFFNLPFLNAHLLNATGLPKTAMNEQYNCCTICNDDYFSFRRQGDAAGRNVSVVWIR
jgi:YfiH family protein